MPSPAQFRGRSGNLSNGFDGARVRSMTPDPNEAPGRLDLLRLFVNTLDIEHGPDALGTLDAASAWCRDHALPPVSNARELARLRDFRETLRELLFANNGEAERAIFVGGAASVRSGSAVRRSVGSREGTHLGAGRRRRRPYDRNDARHRARSRRKRHVDAPARVPAGHVQVRLLRSFEKRFARVVQYGHVRQSRESTTKARA